MVRSDIQILREEIRRMTTEFNEFKAKSVRSEKAMTERIRQLTLENDALKLQIAKNSRRFAVHDSEHSPSSTNSTYNAERDKFRASRAKKEQTGSGYDKTDPEDVPKRRGPPKGHTGTILIKDPDKITLAIEIWITYSKTKWSTNILKSNLNNTRSTIRDLGCA